jgi:hypothetical protein
MSQLKGRKRLKPLYSQITPDVHRFVPLWIAADLEQIFVNIVASVIFA